MKRAINNLMIKAFVLVLLIIVMGQVTFDIDMNVKKSKFSVFESIKNVAENGVAAVKWAKGLT